jgi:Zn-dependent M28 family amino/carboxypeptidase
MAVAIMLVAATPSFAADWVVKPESIRAHENFLASDALRGRGSATSDEAVAATYVAARFESYGLKPAPGMDGYLQSAPVPPSKATSRAHLPAGATTTNAIGYLQGTDPAAGVLLLSAHLDHLGVRDGVTMHGANDDASGTTAVLELAQALAASGPHRRSILFVCYGAEELGGIGSRWFAAHPPVPITDIVANIEFEMIGAQDPKLPAGTMMMTGYDRSTLGPELAQHGGLVTADPYPEQHFFQRSDNYGLALAGVVAHTISGWAVTPTYHQSTDTIANLDIAFMVHAIQSLIGPVRWLADGDYRPQWAGEGRPHE